GRRARIVAHEAGDARDNIYLGNLAIWSEILIEATDRHNLAPLLRVKCLAIATIDRVVRRCLDRTPLLGGRKHIAGEGVAKDRLGGSPARALRIEVVGQHFQPDATGRETIMQLLQRRPSGYALVAKRDGRVAGDAVSDDHLVDVGLRELL